MIDHQLLRECQKMIDEGTLNDQTVSTFLVELMHALAELSAEMNEVKDERNWLRKVVEEHIRKGG